MYKVLKDFADLQDSNHIYRTGDDYPRPGFEVSPNRIKELTGHNNLQGVPLIAESDTEKPKKPRAKTTRKTEKETS